MREVIWYVYVGSLIGLGLMLGVAVIGWFEDWWSNWTYNRKPHACVRCYKVKRRKDLIRAVDDNLYCDLGCWLEDESDKTEEALDLFGDEVKKEPVPDPKVTISDHYRICPSCGMRIGMTDYHICPGPTTYTTSTSTANIRFIDTTTTS